MTNGEKIIAILKPRKDQIRIYDNWVEIEIQKLGINFSCELEWWNTECNELSNKSIVYKAKESKEIQEDLDKLRKLNEPTTKNDLGIDCISRAEVLDLCDSKDPNYEILHLKEDVECLPRVYPMPSVTPQEPTLDKIREEIGKAWHAKPKNRYEEGLKDQALKDMQIIDKYKVESEG